MDSTDSTDTDSSAGARSFAGVADEYQRARPSYPVEAAQWLVGPGDQLVLELGAGTGKLTRHLRDAGTVVATDPAPQMLAHLVATVPEVHAAVATAEYIPLPSRSVDVVVCAQSFHWFDHETALPEIARVLRPGGSLALVWNQRDEAIPWVRRLGALIGTEGQDTDLVRPLRETEHFGWVEERQFRYWQSLNRRSLDDLVRSRSQVALLAEHDRAGVLDRVGKLYDDYGRGPDGMLLPYLTKCYRAVVRHHEPAPARRGGQSDAHEHPMPPEDPGTVLIDFS